MIAESLPTTTKASSFEVRWLVKTKDLNNSFNGKYISSYKTEFNNSSWYLKLGQTVFSPDYLTIWLQGENIDSSKTWLKAKFVIKPDLTKTDDVYEVITDEWKTDKLICNKWISKDEILKDKYWHTDSLFIVCEAELKAEVDLDQVNVDPNELQTSQLLTI